MRHVARRMSPSVAITVGLLLLSAGCASDDPAVELATRDADVESAAAALGLELDPVLDEATGAVVQPYDRFLSSFAERDQIAVATTVLIAQCAQEQGVGYMALDPMSDPIYDSEHYYGPWTVAQAERFGFVTPMSEADLVENGIVSGSTGDEEATPHPNAALSDEDGEIANACGEADNVGELNAALAEGGPWIEQIEAINSALLKTPDVEELLEELGACYLDEGMTPDGDSPWLVSVFNSNEITEEQVQLALKVVACKAEIDFTTRMAQVEADLQAPIIVEYADELIAQRAEIDAALLKAQTLIAENEDLIYKES
jgi:hypothetical protein